MLARPESSLYVVEDRGPGICTAQESQCFFRLLLFVWAYIVSSLTVELSSLNFGLLTLSRCKSLCVKPTSENGKDHLGFYVGCAGVPPQDEVTLEFIFGLRTSWILSLEVWMHTVLICCCLALMYIANFRIASTGTQASEANTYAGQ